MVGLPITFQRAFHWKALYCNLALAVTAVAAFVAWVFHAHQDVLYKRDARRAPNGRPNPESRLYYAAVGGVALPVGLWWFAWTGIPTAHPAAAIAGFGVCQWGAALIYIASFEYLSDAYETSSSSAIASVSLLRNLAAGSFPLFGWVMYNNQNGGWKPQYASTVLAAVASILGVIPFVLLAFGPRLRARSKIATHIGNEVEAASINPSFTVEQKIPDA